MTDFFRRFKRIMGERKGKLLERAEDRTDQNNAPTRPYHLGSLGHAHLLIKVNSQTEKVSLQHGLSIGRSPECYVVLTDLSVSRVHVKFLRSAQGWCVQDISSTNGTLVNGKKVFHAVLQSDDLIQIGQTTLVYKES